MEPTTVFRNPPAISTPTEPHVATSLDTGPVTVYDVEGVNHTPDNEPTPRPTRRFRGAADYYTSGGLD